MAQQPTQIQKAVARWNATKPNQPAPPLMEDFDHVMRLVTIIGQWPISTVQKAERLGFELPPAEPARVQDTVFGLFQRQMERRRKVNDWYDPDLEEQNAQMTDEEKARPFPEHVTIVTPQVNQELGYSYMIRHPNMAWWENGEARNRYVPAGMSVLFRRDICNMNVPLEPLPPCPPTVKTWRQKNAWRNEFLAQIPKKTVTVICEYGSRRCQEGDPVVDIKGNVLRHRYAGEWIREMVAILPGMPSPYFFDDFTNHLMPTDSYKIQAFRQEVADVAFVLLHQ